MKKRQIEALRTIVPGTNWRKFAFPIIRRVLNTNLIDQLVAVQPMALPTAQAFYMDFVHGPVERRPGERRRTLDDPPVWAEEEGVALAGEEAVARANADVAELVASCLVYKLVDRKKPVNENAQREHQAEAAPEIKVTRCLIHGVTVEPPPLRPQIAPA